MTELTAKTKYNMKYAKTKLKRIPLDVQKEKYEEIKAAADAVGESVNGYIKTAIDQRMERDQDKQLRNFAFSYNFLTFEVILFHCTLLYSVEISMAS